MLRRQIAGCRKAAQDFPTRRVHQMKKYAKFQLGSVRFFAFGWLAVLLLLAANPHLSAQTAHAGATIPVGSGFSQPSDVAVDGNGNVFVSDTDHDAVKEIVAVNGAVSSSSQVETVGRKHYWYRPSLRHSAGRQWGCDCLNYQWHAGQSRVAGDRGKRMAWCHPNPRCKRSRAASSSRWAWRWTGVAMCLSQMN